MVETHRENRVTSVQQALRRPPRSRSLRCGAVRSRDQLRRDPSGDVERALYPRPRCNYRRSNDARDSPRRICWSESNQSAANTEGEAKFSLAMSWIVVVCRSQSRASRSATSASSITSRTVMRPRLFPFSHLQIKLIELVDPRRMTRFGHRIQPRGERLDRDDATRQATA